MVTIPGNHDSFPFGILPIKLSDFKRNQCRLNFPLDLDETQIFSEIFKNHNIAIFPFDSNHIGYKSILNFAQGKS